MIEIRRKIAPKTEDLAPLQQAFADYAAGQIPKLPAESADRSFLFTAQHGQRFVGGISGKVYWNGLEIDLLWVDADYRGRGYGSRLVAAAEAFAREQNAVVAFLRTFEARGFYEKLGYTVYGTLEDRPIGTLLYHMKKRLETNPPG